MTVKITTEAKKNAQGVIRITAKGGGKQRTMDADMSIGMDAAHAQAAGVVGNLILDSKQQAMVWHPSMRGSWDMTAPAPGKRVIVLPV